MIKFEYDLFETQLGWVGGVSTPKGLKCLYMMPDPQEVMELLDRTAPDALYEPNTFTNLKKNIEKYLLGELTSLNTIKLDLSMVPPFFSSAWQACRTIPIGETRSYAWLAASAGKPLAARAAGQAMAKNRFVLIVPCHRVIGSDGTLTGYGAGGIAVKARLLEMEYLSRSNESMHFGDNIL
jgi:methylated-DNA-[protein]-cysteine S-methyltransferase